MVTPITEHNKSTNNHASNIKLNPASNSVVLACLLLYGRFMANRTHVIEVIAPVLGMNPMTLDRILRDLALNGFVPRVAPGKRSPHYGLLDLVHVLLGCTANQPSEAAGAVAALSDLRASDSSALTALGVSPNAVPPGTRFSVYLGYIIKMWANPTDEMLASIKDEPSWLPILTISMSPSMRRAHVTDYTNGALCSSLFLPADPKFMGAPPMARRELIITRLVLKAAGELLADTLAKQTTTLVPDPSPGSAGEGDATPDEKKASRTGIHEGLPSERSTSRAYPAPTQTDPLSKVKSSEGQGSNQRASVSSRREAQVRHQPTTMRTRYHDPAHWTAPSPPPG